MKCKIKWYLSKKKVCQNCGGYYKIGFVHIDEGSYICNKCDHNGDFRIVKNRGVQQKHRCTCNNVYVDDVANIDDYNIDDD